MMVPPIMSAQVTALLAEAQRNAAAAANANALAARRAAVEVQITTRYESEDPKQTQ